MASERLPNAVNSILETPPGEDVVPPEVEPVRVRGGAEVAKKGRKDHLVYRRSLSAPLRLLREKLRPATA